MKFGGIFIILFLCFTFYVFASGSKRPPRLPSNSQSYFSPEQLKAGKDLYEKGFGENKCIACHDKGKSQAFKRSSLKRNAKELPDLINACLENKDRAKGKTIDKKSKEMGQVLAFLIDKYRLPKSSIDVLK